MAPELDRTDRYSAALLVVIGIAAVVQALQYDVGTLAKIGPGAFPAAMGIILILCGMALWLQKEERAADGPDPMAAATINYRGLIFVTGSFLAFVLLAKPAGLLIAGFATVGIASLADRSTSLKQAFAIAAALAVLGTGLFCYGLKVSLEPVAFWSLG